MKIVIVSFFTLLLLISCNKEDNNSIVGLWEVEKVSMGDHSMTPIARWMKFESDNTQVSGNGWLQHSYGNWSLTGKDLSVEDFNGVSDNTNPFSI